LNYGHSAQIPGRKFVQVDEKLFPKKHLTNRSLSCIISMYSREGSLWIEKCRCLSSYAAPIGTQEGCEQGVRDRNLTQKNFYKISKKCLTNGAKYDIIIMSRGAANPLKRYSEPALRRVATIEENGRLFSPSKTTDRYIKLVGQRCPTRLRVARSKPQWEWTEQSLIHKNRWCL
jgi:hypothetical protein